MSEADGPTDDDAAEDTDAADGTADADGTDDAVGATGAADPDDDRSEPTGRADPNVSSRITQEDIDDLRREIDDLEERLEDGTVHRDEIERDLRQYVRRRQRRGHATGWGPYLVLLYGTAMTLGAFSFLGGLWAILAMLIIWLSTLGLYVLMLLVGVTVKTASVPGKLIDMLRSLR